MERTSFLHLPFTIYYLPDSISDSATLATDSLSASPTSVLLPRLNLPAWSQQEYCYRRKIFATGGNARRAAPSHRKSRLLLLVSLQPLSLSLDFSRMALSLSALSGSVTV